MNPQAFAEYMRQSPRPISFIIVRNPLERLLSAYRKVVIYETHFMSLWLHFIAMRCNTSHCSGVSQKTIILREVV